MRLSARLGAAAPTNGETPPTPKDWLRRSFPSLGAAAPTTPRLRLRSSFPSLYAVVAAAVLVSASSSALAQQQPSPADRETARSLMDEGDKKRDGGDLKGALKSYEAADAIMKVPTTGLEVAKAQIALGLLLEARETLGRVLRIPAKPTDPPPFVAARKSAETMNSEVGPRIPSIQITLQNADGNTNAQMMIDGEPIPAAAAFAPRKVNPGAHAVVVKAGSFDKKLDVNVAERETKTVTVDLKEKPPEVVKAAGPEEKPSTEKTNALPKILMFGGFGLAAVGVGVGAVTGLMSISKTNDLKDICTNDKCPVDKQGEIDDAKGLGNISTIAFIVGGVGVGAGIVGLVLSRKEKRELPAAAAPQARLVRPIISPTYVGVSGTF
jgi:hypothetical protein